MINKKELKKIWLTHDGVSACQIGFRKDSAHLKEYMVYDYKCSVDNFSFKRPEKPNVEWLTKKNIRICFEKKPPIDLICTKVSEKEIKRVAIESKRFFFFPIKFNAVYYENVLEYTLFCGSYKFQLTQEEADALYYKVELEYQKVKNELENAEIDSRMKKYNL